MSITTRSFGTTKKGEEVTLFRLENSRGMVAEIINYGANLVSLWVPDKDGKLADVVLGFDTVAGYEVNPCFFGSTIGRSANRIAKAKCTIAGKEYQLEVNDGENNLHSHFNDCFNKKLFDAEILENENAVKLSIYSPAGDQGFPGNLTASVIYRLTEDNGLELEYDAVSDEDTLYNVTNHSYFNLSGHASGSAMDHELMLNCKAFTPTFPGSIPTGELAAVNGTPFDFTTSTVIGKRIDEENEQLALAGGYDHNFVCNIKPYGAPELIAVLSDAKSGRKMTVYTDLPGVQFYAGNFISTQKGKENVTYGKRHGVCLETQFFPNAINQPEFDSPLLKAGEKFHSVTIYKFA